MSASTAPAQSSAARPDVHEDLMATLKRRGYLQPSYEIYGGVAGFFDYGPLGAALKTNVENLWRRFYVLGEGMAEIQCATVSPEQVFRASGHLEKFADTVVDCTNPACGSGNRGDHLVRNEFARISVIRTKRRSAAPFRSVLENHHYDTQLRFGEIGQQASRL